MKSFRRLPTAFAARLGDVQQPPGLLRPRCALGSGAAHLGRARGWGDDPLGCGLAANEFSVKTCGDAGKMWEK